MKTYADGRSSEAVSFRALNQPKNLSCPHAKQPEMRQATGFEWIEGVT
jgi:hypothetical protein